MLALPTPGPEMVELLQQEVELLDEAIRLCDELPCRGEAGNQEPHRPPPLLQQPLAPPQQQQQQQQQQQETEAGAGPAGAGGALPLPSPEALDFMLSQLPAAAAAAAARGSGGVRDSPAAAAMPSPGALAGIVPETEDCGLLEGLPGVAGAAADCSPGRSPAGGMPPMNPPAAPQVVPDSPAASEEGHAVLGLAQQQAGCGAVAAAPAAACGQEEQIEDSDDEEARRPSGKACFQG